MQIVSQVEAQGEVAVQELADIQGQIFDSARILVSNKIGGMEDIPVSPCDAHKSTAAASYSRMHVMSLPMMARRQNCIELPRTLRPVVTMLLVVLWDCPDASG